MLELFDENADKFDDSFLRFRKDAMQEIEDLERKVVAYNTMFNKLLHNHINRTYGRWCYPDNLISMMTSTDSKQNNFFLETLRITLGLDTQEFLDSGMTLFCKHNYTYYGLNNFAYKFYFYILDKNNEMLGNYAIKVPTTRVSISDGEYECKISVYEVKNSNSYHTVLSSFNISDMKQFANILRAKTNKEEVM